MNPLPRPLRFLASCLLGTGVFAPLAQGDVVENSCQIDSALGIDFCTEPGTTYRIESSETLSAWTPEDKVFYGDGDTKGSIFPFESNVSGKYFRVRMETEPSDGPAPWHPEGKRYILNDGGAPTSIALTSPSQGTLTTAGGQPEPFSYAHLKTGPDVLELTLEGGTPNEHIVVLHFTSASVGTYSSVRKSPGGEDNDSGSFIQELVSSTDPFEPFAMPVQIGPRHVIFKDRAGCVELTQLTSTSGTATSETLGDRPVVVGYTRDSLTTATLTLDYGPDEQEVNTISLTHGGGGAFVRKTYQQNALVDTDEGAFSWVADGPSGN